MGKMVVFVKGMYQGFMAIGLTILLANDLYWSFKTGQLSISWQRNLTLIAAIVVVPWIFKLRSTFEKALSQSQK